MANNNNFYALNLPDETARLCAQNAKDKIAELETIKAEFMPEYEEQKEFYEKVRDEFSKVQNRMDGLLNSIKAQQTIVTAFNTFGSIKVADKRFQRISNEKHSTSGFKNNVSWIDEAEKLLKTHDRFMSTEEIWGLFSKDEKLVASANKNKVKFTLMKCAALDGIIKHALRSKGKLCIYKEKLGLAAWVDDSGVADINYIKTFMFNQDLRIQKILRYNGNVGQNNFVQS